MKLLWTILQAFDWAVTFPFILLLATLAYWADEEEYEI